MQSVDRYPVRSPQAVQSAIAEIVSGRDVVEIGTRNGDGMECFAQYARSAVAVEYDQQYCELLKLRGGRNACPTFGTPFSVLCSRYQDVSPDADYFTWWAQAPHLMNVPLLLHLRRAQLQGKIRANATALVVLAHGEARKHAGSGLLRMAAWTRAVPFKESHKAAASLTGGRRNLERFRTEGVWHVVAVPLSAISLDRVSRWKDLKWGESEQV